MPLPGGSTDKFGNRYEGRWTAACMAEILNEMAISIRIEPPGLEDKGFEFWLRRKDIIEYHQVKRQTSKSGSWTLKLMGSEGILGNFYNKLKADDKNHCFFISSQSAHDLDELADRSRRSASYEEFKAKFVESAKQAENFKAICLIWTNSSEKETYELIKRIHIETISEDTLRNKLIISSFKPLIEDNPSTVAENLAYFALDEINKELNAYNIWRHLKDRGFKLRVWNKDPNVISKLNSCTDRNLPQLYDSTIAGKEIKRDESRVILDKLLSSNDKKAILIYGDAGVGKSCIVHQVAEALQKQKVPLLVFRVDRLDPMQLPEAIGLQLGLPDSPPIVLKAIAQSHRCVLIIDQLDSVSETSGRNPDFFNCIYEIIKQALEYPEMRVLLACRKFDLDNDHRLRSLIDKKGIADSVKIMQLSNKIIRQFIIDNLNLNIARLNETQLSLLSIPLNLRLLAEIAQHKEMDIIDFNTTKDLYDKFWEVKGKLLNQRLKGPSNWTDAIFNLSNYMSKYQTLIAPGSILDKFDILLIEAMASEHILIKDENKYTFFHQSFFDYVFARNFCAEGNELLPFLKKDKQHLFRRSQVRQILLHERDVDPKCYIANLKSVLNDQKIRFHLKEIVLALLADLSNPISDEWKIIAPFLNNPLDPLHNKVKYILFKSIKWIKLSNKEGQLKRWLDGNDEDNIKFAVILLSIVQKEDPDLVMDLIEPYVDVSEIWCKRISSIIKNSRIDASERFFKLVLDFLDKGGLDSLDELNPFSLHFWYAQKNFIKDNTIWACEFLGHYLNRRLQMTLKAGQSNPFNRNSGSIPYHIKDNEILLSVKKCAMVAPNSFILEVIPFILKVIELTAYKDEEIIDSPWYDQVWRYRYYHGRFGNYIHECLLSSIEVAMATLAEIEPENFRNIEKILGGYEFETIHYLMIRSYASNGERFADDAVNYLAKYPACLGIGYVEDRHIAMRELLKAITPYCSEEQISQVMIMILRRYPDQRNRSHRLSQFNLLYGIKSVKSIEPVNRRFEDLEYEFGKVPEEPLKYRNYKINCQFVKSPIAEDKIDLMTDEQWLEAISFYNSEEESFNIVGDDFIGGARQLSNELEKQVKKNPKRFALLVQSFSNRTNIHYFNAVLRGMSEANLDEAMLLDVCRRCHNLENKPCGKEISDIIGKASKHALSHEMLDMVAWYATRDPDPISEVWRIKNPDGTVLYGGDIIFAGLNSVRGRAAEAIANLIFYEKKRIPHLKPAIEMMVNDPLIEVRSWVASALISVLRHEGVLAVKLFHQLCECEDILLGTHHVEWFLRYALQNYFSTLLDILERMIASTESEVVKVGARQICLASIDLEEARPFMEACLIGTKDQRLGAAEVFAANLKINPDLCKSKLIKLFNDNNSEITAEAASCWKNLVEDDLEKFSDLIDIFINSKAFSSNKEELLWALGKTTSKLPEITFVVVKKIIDSITYDNNHGALVENEISKLILRVYSQNLDNDLGIRCLDLIDIMIEKSLYRISKEIISFDR